MSGCPFNALYKRLTIVERAKPRNPLPAMEAWYDLLIIEQPTRKRHWLQQKRAARKAIHANGTYRHSFEELELGAKIAWRHSIRCLGRYFWSEMDVFDARTCETEKEIFEHCVRHLNYATNQGNIRSTITIFAPDSPEKPGPRIVNPQLIRYAGYAAADGTVIGDPLSIELTRQIQELGWKPRQHGRFDVLPVVIQLNGSEPTWFELPSESVLEVPLAHPTLPAFQVLGLKWHAVPIISNMVLEIGGIRYPCAPFNGWYMGTEIGARNLADVDRYNMLPAVATLMGLDTQNNQSLWRDRALIELNQAVLHSFRKAGVKIIDHHAAAQLHVKFEEQERAANRPVTGSWSWLVPPISGSASPIWPRLYDETQYAPAFLPS